jgi:hypothetical protein
MEKFTAWYADAELVLYYKNFVLLVKAKNWVRNKRLNGYENGLLK